MIDNVEKIAERLAEIFPGETVYSENQKSGFDVPSFYIHKVDTESSNRLFGIQVRKYSYQIVYFANPDNPNADIERVEELLLDNFCALKDYATVTNRSTHPDSDQQTLTFEFDLRLDMHPVEDVASMERIEQNGGVKD